MVFQNGSREKMLCEGVSVKTLPETFKIYFYSQ